MRIITFKELEKIKETLPDPTLYVKTTKQHYISYELPQYITIEKITKESEVEYIKNTIITFEARLFLDKLKECYKWVYEGCICL